MAKAKPTNPIIRNKLQLKEAKGSVGKLEREKASFERQYFQTQSTLARTTKELCEIREQSGRWRETAAKNEGREGGLQHKVNDLQVWYLPACFLFYLFCRFCLFLFFSFLTTKCAN